MSPRRAASAFALVWSALGSTHGHAQDVPVAYLCGNLVGSYLAAPNWRVEGDGAKDQLVILTYKGDKSLSTVSWVRLGEMPYYESPGLAVAMKSGFVIVTFSEDFTETYVFNAGTTELLFSSVRSGSAVLPNAIKTLRGTCTPAGTLAR